MEMCFSHSTRIIHSSEVKLSPLLLSFTAPAPQDRWQIYLLTPWSRVLLEKLTSFQLVKKFPTFYGNCRLIIAFISARHLFLSWARSIQSMPPHPTSWSSILILSPIYAWVFQVASFRQVSSPTPCAHLYPPPYALHALPISLVSILPPAQYWVRSTVYFCV